MPTTVIVLLLASLGFWLRYIFAKRQYAHLCAVDARCDGVVIKASLQQNEGWLTIRVAYDVDGVTYRKKYLASPSLHLRRGSCLEMRYDPARPKNAVPVQIDVHKRYRLYAIIFTIATICFAVLELLPDALFR